MIFFIFLIISFREGEFVDPADLWSALETGTLLIENDQGKKTHLYFKTLTSQTTFGTDARLEFKSYQNISNFATLIANLVL